jgi:hypothetical protein
MADFQDRKTGSTEVAGEKTRASQREERLAQALRANLKRRKDQARNRTDDQTSRAATPMDEPSSERD